MPKMVAFIMTVVMTCFSVLLLVHYPIIYNGDVSAHQSSWLFEVLVVCRTDSSDCWPIVAHGLMKGNSIGPNRKKKTSAFCSEQCRERADLNRNRLSGTLDGMMLQLKLN